MSRGPKLAVLCGSLGALGLVAALWLAVRHRERDADFAAPARPAQPTESAAPESSARSEQRAVAVELPAQTVAAIGAALGAQLGRATAVEQAIADARQGRIDALAFGRRLHEATQGHPELGRGLLDALAEERRPPLALQLAQALAALEDDAPLRRETLDALRSGPAAARAVGLLALLGRREPEALQLAADTLSSSDGDDARATAAFLLNSAAGNGRLDGALEAQALAAAREALGDPRSSQRLREEAVTLLGQSGAAAEDVALLEQNLFGGAEAVRVRALAALEATRVDRARLRQDFARVLGDPGSPQRLREMASAWLAAQQ